MFVLTLENHNDGVYSLFDKDKNRVIPIFQLEDDANRYLTMLEDTSPVSYTQLTLPTKA